MNTQNNQQMNKTNPLTNQNPNASFSAGQKNYNQNNQNNQNPNASFSGVYSNPNNNPNPNQGYYPNKTTDKFPSMNQNPAFKGKKDKDC